MGVMQFKGHDTTLGGDEEGPRAMPEALSQIDKGFTPCGSDPQGGVVPHARASAVH